MSGVHDFDRRPARVEDRDVRIALLCETFGFGEFKFVAVEPHRLVVVIGLNHEAQLKDSRGFLVGRAPTISPLMLGRAPFWGEWRT